MLASGKIPKTSINQSNNLISVYLTRLVPIKLLITKLLIIII